MMTPVISTMILLPFFAAIYIAISKTPYYRILSFICASINSIIGSILYIYFDTSRSDYQFLETYDFIEIPLGVDSLSILFIMLTILIINLVVIFELEYKKERYFFTCILFLESFLILAFSAINILVFYIAYEMVLIPMFFIIGIWGSENRVYASFKLFLYTLFGSIFALLAIIYIYIQTSTFNMVFLSQILPGAVLNVQIPLWIAFFLSFAIKIPMFPFHNWLPDAHVQAPTSGSVILASLLLKLGAYGFLRISVPMLPDASYFMSDFVICISILSLVYASLAAFGQKQIKQVIAYSSIAHMSYTTAGIFSFNQPSISGAIYQMFSHGIISAALFFIVGCLYERTHEKLLENYQGLKNSMPILSTISFVMLLGSVGLPGTSGFIAEILCLIGIFSNNPYYGVVMSTGVVLGATYMLKTYSQVFFGKENVKLSDLRTIEILVFLPLVFGVIYLGIQPSSFLDFTVKAADQTLKIFSGSIN